MRSLSFISAIVAMVLSLSTSVIAQSVDPIVIKGSKFFYKTNGTQFFIKGVAYQQDVGSAGTSSTSITYTDPLANATGCARDIPYMLKLQTNVVRVYAVDPTLDHDQCMSMFANAGIYVIADLSQPSESINSDDPEWTDELYERYTSVVDALQKYDNVLGFFAGNEVANRANNSDAIPFVKAAVRDIKAYIQQKNYRAIGVGYAADDDQTIRANLEDYINCGSAEDSVDFFGYNIYSWCGQSDYVSSFYEARTEEFANYSVPAFFAEYGCNKVEPRIFQETGALYGSNMSKVWSGGIVFMWFQETNNFGLVTVSGNSISTLTDFDNLSTAIAKVSPSSINEASYAPSNTVPRACPVVSSTATAASSAWLAASNLPPTPNEELCACMVQNASCVANPSLSGDDIEKAFGVVCGETDCEGVFHFGINGTYGAYSMCNATEQLTWAFDVYYKNQTANNPQNTDACDFNGAAKPQTPQSGGSACEALVSQAGAAGTGTVTSAPTGTVAPAESAATTSKGSAAGVNVPTVDFGTLRLGGFVTVAAMVGAVMILL